MAIPINIKTLHSGKVGEWERLDLRRGRPTGFPKVYNALRGNGSPEPIFETAENNSYFLATIPIHPAFNPANTGMYQTVEDENEGEGKEKSRGKVGKCVVTDKENE